MPLHTIELIESEFENLANIKVAVLGVSYLENLGDTRHSPSKTLVEFLRKDLAVVKVHDPYVESWPEVEEAIVYNKLEDVIPDADVIVFAVGHNEYRDLNPEMLVQLSGNNPLIIDCSNFLSDETIKQYLKLNCRVMGVGKGHIKNLI